MLFSACPSSQGSVTCKVYRLKVLTATKLGSFGDFSVDGVKKYLHKMALSSCRYRSSKFRIIGCLGGLFFHLYQYQRW